MRGWVGGRSGGRDEARATMLYVSGQCLALDRDRDRDRGGYREPPELAEGGNEGRSGTAGNHRKTGREAERPPRSSSGGQPGPKASNQQPNRCSQAQH